jgi:hypothetical protein
MTVIKMEKLPREPEAIAPERRAFYFLLVIRAPTDIVFSG